MSEHPRVEPLNVKNDESESFGFSVCFHLCFLISSYINFFAAAPSISHHVNSLRRRCDSSAQSIERKTRAQKKNRFSKTFCIKSFSLSRRLIV